MVDCVIIDSMATPQEIAVIRSRIAELRHACRVLQGRLGGSVGGRARNPRKGFGSGDNARRAVLARWSRLRKG